MIKYIFLFICVFSNNAFFLRPSFLKSKRSFSMKNFEYAKEYFDFYKKFTTKNFEQNEISVIYLLGSDDEIPFSKIKNYFIDKCFKNITIIDKRFSAHELKKC